MSNSPSTHFGARPFLGKLAAAGMIVECGCHGCRKKRTYLAADLADYMGAHAIVGELWSGCPYCQSGASWWERYRHPSSDDVLNRTMIRKLKGWRRTAIWVDEHYQAPPAAPEPAPDGLVPWKGLG